MMDKEIQLGSDVTIAIRRDALGCWDGVGQIKVGGQELLASGKKWICEIRTPEGVELCRYVMIDLIRQGETTILRFRPHARQTRQMEWMVHATRQRLNLQDTDADPTPLPGTTVELELTPVRRTLGSSVARGFRYSWRFSSDNLNIYQILDRAAWSPGGTVCNCEIRQRNCFVNSQEQIQGVDTHWSTEWYLPDCENPNVFQLVPFQTELNGFTFLSGPRGTLLTWTAGVSHIRSLIEKPRGVDAVLHWHQHCADLGARMETVPMEVLWVAGGLDDAQRGNLHERMRELVYSTLHEDLGLAQDRVLTHGMMQEWGNPDLDQYLHRGLPLLLKAGVKEIFVPNWLTQNQAMWNMGNFCANIDYRVAPRFGVDRVKALTEAARAGGARLQMWFGTYVSKMAQLTWDWTSPEGYEGIVTPPADERSLGAAIKRASSPWVRDYCGQKDRDHYDNVVCLNLRDQTISDHIVDAMRRLHDELGLDAIFNDSSFNLSMDKFSYRQNIAGSRVGATADQVALLGNRRPAVEPHRQILSQYRAALEMWVRLQKIGYRICGEDIGVFGVHRHGSNSAMRCASPSLWSNCVGEFDSEVIRAAGFDVEMSYFTCMAYRHLWTVNWDMASDRLGMRDPGDANKTAIRGPHDEVTEYHLGLIRAYNQVEPYLHNRQILPGGQGVMYRSGVVNVFWSFEESRLDLGGNLVAHDLLSGQRFEGMHLQAHPKRLYRLEPR